MTIEELFNHYYGDYAQHRCRTAEWMQANFVRYFGSLKDLEVTAIKPYDVQRWHNQIGSAHGEPTANRALTHLRTLYNFGEKWQLIECRNPAKAVRKFKESSRERIVTDTEMPILLKAIDEHGTLWTRDLFLMCLYTAQRLSNVCSMKWADLDLTNGQWGISSLDYKTGIEHSVPLVDEALAILSRRTRESAFVFPGRWDKSTHIGYPYNGWRKVLKVAGISDLNPHDLRRTHASYQVDNDTSVPVIAKTLGQSDFTATAIYARAKNNKVRDAMQQAVRAMRK